MRKMNSKQFILIAGSLLVAAVLNWLIWFVIMRHPGDIALMYHMLTTICLASALVVIGDKFMKTQIFK